LGLQSWAVIGPSPLLAINPVLIPTDINSPAPDTPTHRVCDPFTHDGRPSARRRPLAVPSSVPRRRSAHTPHDTRAVHGGFVSSKPTRSNRPNERGAVLRQWNGLPVAPSLIAIFSHPPIGQTTHGPRGNGAFRLPPHCPRPRPPRPPLRVPAAPRRHPRRRPHPPPPLLPTLGPSNSLVLPPLFVLRWSFMVYSFCFESLPLQ